MPFTQNKFGDLYGYGNLDTIFYGFLPIFILVKFKCPIFRRILYASLILGSYSLLRIFLIKDYKIKFFDAYRINSKTNTNIDVNIHIDKINKINNNNNDNNFINNVRQKMI
jgi:hypothetical protein